MTRNTYYELYILKSFLNKEKKGIQTENAFKKKIKIFEGALEIEFFLKKDLMFLTSPLLK